MAKLPETENTFEITSSWLNALKVRLQLKICPLLIDYLSQIAIGGTLWLSLGV